MKKLLFIGTLLTLVAGCGEKIHTVDEFTKNDELRKSILAKCKNGELDELRDRNCENASKAQRQIELKGSITHHGTKF